MWVQHPVYSKYMVSDNGDVRHVNSGKNRVFRKSKSGYFRFNVTVKSRCITLMVHTMVADCFVKNKTGLATVNHIDGNKINNNATNLEWMSLEDNVSDSYSRPHGNCTPIVIGGVRFRSLREASRITGTNINKLKED